MKKSLLIASTLAMVLGVGVAVGARQARVAKVDAWSGAQCGTTWYATGTIGGSAWGTWHDFTLNNETDRYEYTFDANKDDEFKFGNNKTYADQVTVHAGYSSDLDWAGKGWNSYTTGHRDGDKPNFQIKADGNYTLYFDKNITTYDNGIWAFGIQKNVEKVDPSETTKQFYVYDQNKVLGNTLANVNVYGYGEAETIKPMSWPGIHNGVTSATVNTRSVYSVSLSESYPNFIMNCGSGNNQTDNVIDLADHVGDVLVIGALKEGETKVYTTSWRDVDQFPAADGYYIVGNNIGWRYADAEVMTSNPDFSPLDTDGNIAKYIKLTVAQNERIKLRSYINGVDTWINVTEDAYDFGERDNTETENNGSFVFSKAGDYNIWAKNNVFYISEYEEILTATVTKVLFEGAESKGTKAGDNQNCVKGKAFTPVASSESGYSFLGYFTDEDCETAFVNGTVVNTNINLYAKFMKHGYYMISEAGNWEVENGVLMDTESISPSNKAEMSLIVTVANSKYNFTEYDGEKKNGQDGLGDPYDFVELVDGDYKNIKFKKTGTFQIYWSAGNNKIYINEGADAFYSNFLNKVSAVCETVGSEGYIANLQAEWAKQKISYNSLSEAEQNAIKAVGFDGGSDVDDLHKVVKKYNRIVTKYGSALFEDFIWGQVNIQPQTSVLYPSPIAETTNVPVIIIVAATITAISAGLFFILKKKETK